MSLTTGHPSNDPADPKNEQRRSLQARGYNPFGSELESDSDDWKTEMQGWPAGTPREQAAYFASYKEINGVKYAPEMPRPARHQGPKPGESWATVERRRLAAQILDSPELLMMASLRDNLSLAYTRLKYTRMLCGVLEPSNPRENPPVPLSDAGYDSYDSDRISVGNVSPSHRYKNNNKQGQN